MKLSLHSANVADLETAKSFYGTDTGDLVAPVISMFYPVDTSDTVTLKKRVEWSLDQQIELASNDPTMRLVKVIDEDAGGAIVSIGRWHFYPNGYEPVADHEVAGSKDRNDPETWPSGFDKDGLVAVLDPLFAARREWMKPRDGPYWVLTTVVTREPLRRHGAGSIVLKWGLEQARKDGTPAYLEAAPVAKGLYLTHGFKEVGSQLFSIGGVEATLCRMRADP